MGEELLDKSKSKIMIKNPDTGEWVELPSFEPMAFAFEDFGNACQECSEAANRLNESLKFSSTIKFTGRIAYLAYHHKKLRVRKKNQRRLRELTIWIGGKYKKNRKKNYGWRFE